MCRYTNINEPPSHPATQPASQPAAAPPPTLLSCMSTHNPKCFSEIQEYKFRFLLCLKLQMLEEIYVYNYILKIVNLKKHVKTDNRDNENRYNKINFKSG